MSGHGPGALMGYVCPTCKKAVAATVRWRPFCTERCKLVDLGGWFLEKYRIAGDGVDPDDDAAARAGTPEEPA